MEKIDFYLKKEQIIKDKTVVTLAKKYLDKSRNNLVTMNLLSELNNQKTIELLKFQKIMIQMNG